MKILFDNAAERATITSSNENASYPPSNLVHQFLELRWQESITNQSVITITFDDAEDVNCVFLAYMNVIGAVAYTNTGALAHVNNTGYYEATSDHKYVATSDGKKIAMGEAIQDVTVLYFDSLQEDVTSITIYVYSSATPIYLGGVGVGEAYTMPNPVSDFEEGHQDNSTSSNSAFGQDSQNYIEPLREEMYNFRGILRDTKEEIMTLYRSVGVGGKVWVDLTERNHSFKKPMYCKLFSSPASSKDGNRYSFKMRFMEAR